MQAKTILGGLLLATGLLTLSCGGVEADESAQGFSQTEQAVTTACAPGYYSTGSYWTCEPVCPGIYWGNILRRMCTNGTDYYEVDVKVVCGQPCY
jgi:hypothetical protein